jgi:malate dehydrogenase (oxaloacetate-decarboxylating)(NADP+)
MQADTAISPEMAREHFPFSAIQGDANVLIFPDLTSSNIAYKLLRGLGGAEVVGPILVGLSRPVHVLHPSNDVSDIVNLTALAVTEAQERARKSGLKEPAGTGAASPPAREVPQEIL